MNLDTLPKWMNVIPSLIGVALAIAGIYIFPMFGLRNTLGPILGLPLGLIVGVVILSRIATIRSEREYRLR